MLTLSNFRSFLHKNILDHAGNKYIVGDTVDIDDDDESVGDKSSESASKYPLMDSTVRLFEKPTINFEASAYYNMIHFSHWKSFLPVQSQSSDNFHLMTGEKSTLTSS